MNIHPLAVPPSPDSLHMQNQKLLGRAGGKIAPKKASDGVGRTVGEMKLVMGKGRNIAK